MMPSHLIAGLVLLVCLSALMLAALLGIQARQRRHRTQQLAGLEVLSIFRLLITQVQQHRGLTTGILNGSGDMRQRVVSLQRDIDRHFDRLEQYALVAQLERWSASSEHWQRLKVQFASLDSHNNLLQHNCLIQTLLYLVEDVADASFLSGTEQPATAPIETLWTMLLPLAEILGQSRALGTGIAAARVCSSVNRIRMQFLLGKLRESIHAASTQPVQPLPHTVVDQLQRFEQLIQHALLTPDKPTIAPEQFFQQATDTLEAVLHEVDQGIAAARQALQDRGPGRLKHLSHPAASPTTCPLNRALQSNPIG